jgi:hypothetical protein
MANKEEEKKERHGAATNFFIYFKHCKNILPILALTYKKKNFNDHPQSAFCMTKSPKFVMKTCEKEQQNHLSRDISPPGYSPTLFLV